MAELKEQKQIWLLEYKNPLATRFSIEFFKKIPTTPGVYCMLGEQKAILYIGKAKNLRNRLRSYQQIKPDKSPRKLVRLVHLIHEIKWEECETEEKALLRENYLLRTLRPPFNVHNTHPESYYLIAFEAYSTHMSFRLTTQPIAHENEELFGAFKSRGLIRRGFAAILRLLWVVLSKRKTTRFEFPSVLSRRTVPFEYSILINQELSEFDCRLWKLHIRRFLKGTSQRLLSRLTQELLECPEIPSFMYHFVQLDLETLTEFYQSGPKRNKVIKKFHKLDKSVLAQDQLDDLIVSYRINSTQER